MKTSRKAANAGSWLLLIILTTGCTLGVSNNSNFTTETDIEIAGQILGGSLSTDNSGVMLSISDALTIVSSNSFNKETAGSATLQTEDRSGRGNETDYRHSYNQKTGTHTVSFIRNVQSQFFSKTVTDTLKYIFTASSGDYIEFPRQNRVAVETIDFTGHRIGSSETLREQSSFVRRDTFLIGGVSDASPTLSINGVHNGRGIIEVDRPNSDPINRSYKLKVNFLNIKISKAAFGTNRTLNHDITGSLNWQMVIQQNSGGESGAKTIRGTIGLNGDGTALLRFKDYLKLFQVNLENGEVKDQEEEFEGRVHFVNLDDQNITLISGRTVYLDENTEFDNDEYPSLQAVANALDNNERVWTEGEGFIKNEQFMITEIEFEREEDGDSKDHIDFEESVSSVDLEANTFVLADEVVIQIDNQTVFDDSGDYQSLKAVSDALDQGIRVDADGEAIQSAESAKSDITAIYVEFESDE